MAIIIITGNYVIISDKFIYLEGFQPYMKRKINRVGTSTLTVSLPSKWAKQQGLKAGDEVDVGEEGSKLIIEKTGISCQLKSINVDFTKFSDRLIKLTLNNLYREGYNQIHIKFASSKQHESIHQYCNNLIGFEIIKKNDGFCTIESVTNPDVEKFDALLRRAFLLLKEELELIKSDMEKNSYQNMPLVKQYSGKVSQYINFCMRNVMNHKEHQTKEQPVSLMLFGLILVKATNRRLYEYLIKDKPKVQKDVIDIMEKIIQNYDDYCVLFYKKDVEHMIKLNDSMENLLEELYKLSAKKKDGEAIVINILSQFVRLMTSMISPATAIVMEV